MRIALLSDLHGNEVALDAVLSDVYGKGVDRIVCLGDTAALGPRPRAVLARLRDLGCPCIMGNHDAFMLDSTLIHQYTRAPVVVEAVDWCRARLSPDDLAFISSFVATLELQLGDSGQVLLFHGTPRSHTEDLVSTTPDQALDGIVAGTNAFVLAGGHTHIPMLRHHRGRVLVNPGSVGMPFEQYVHGQTPTILPSAQWGCLEYAHGQLDVTLRRIELERKALRAEAAATQNPIGPGLVAQYA